MKGPKRNHPVFDDYGRKVDVPMGFAPGDNPKALPNELNAIRERQRAANDAAEAEFKAAITKANDRNDRSRGS